MPAFCIMQMGHLLNLQVCKAGPLNMHSHHVNQRKGTPSHPVCSRCEERWHGSLRATQEEREWASPSGLAITWAGSTALQLPVMTGFIAQPCFPPTRREPEGCKSPPEGLHYHHPESEWSSSCAVPPQRVSVPPVRESCLRGGMAG